MSGVGGAERMTITFAKQLDNTKYDVVFCVLESKNDNKIEVFIPNGYPIIHIPFSFGLNPKVVWTFYKVLKKEKPDIVFSSLISINFRLLLLAPLFRDTKFVVRNNINLWSPSISRKQKAFMRMVYPRAEVVIAQTEEMKKEITDVLNIEDSKVVVIHNPIDTQTIDLKLKDYENFMDKDKTNYVAVCRFSKGKGLDILIKAFNEVCKHDPDSELYIVGRYDESSEYYQKVLELINNYAITSHIHIVGFTDNPYRYMKNADCFVLPSRSEGLPNALIEAQYIGTPAAACTCVPVIERIVGDGKTGFLADVEDYDGLAKAMMKASKLGRIKSRYKPTPFDNFLELL